MVAAVVAAVESGELAKAVAGGHDTWAEWTKGLGKALGRKGKGLFMPLRLALTGRLVVRPSCSVPWLLAAARSAAAHSPAVGGIPVRGNPAPSATLQSCRPPAFAS